MARWERSVSGSTNRSPAFSSENSPTPTSGATKSDIKEEKVNTLFASLGKEEFVDEKRLNAMEEAGFSAAVVKGLKI